MLDISQYIVIFALTTYHLRALKNEKKFVIFTDIFIIPIILHSFV